MTGHTSGLLIILALGLLMVPLTAAAPPPGKMPRLGVLEFGSPLTSPALDARELGTVT